MRELSPAFIAALENDILFPIFFMEGEFKSGTLRIVTEMKGRVWDGKTWTASGWLIGMSEVEETTDTRSPSFTLGMTGHETPVTIALAEWQQNRDFMMWLGLLDPLTKELIDVVPWYGGLSDISMVSINPTKPGVKLRYKSKLADLTRARVRRQTPEDQAIDFPDDTFYNFINPDAAIHWGADSGV